MSAARTACKCGERTSRNESMMAPSESVVEHAPLAWFEALGNAVKYAPGTALSDAVAERIRPGYADIVRKRCLHGARWPKVACRGSQVRTVRNRAEMAA